MKLLIDIGNTRIKWLLVNASDKIPMTIQAGAVTHHQNFVEALDDCFCSGGEFSRLLAASSLRKPKEVWVSNVAGEQAKDVLSSFAKTQWHLSVNFATVQKRQDSIQNSYQVLSELGVDRWMAILGARQVFLQGDVIVINCGTAITVDVLNSENCFLGGVILPGFQLVANSLSRADGIGRFEPIQVEKSMGVRTSECVQLGVMSACVGGVERVVAEIKQELGSDFVNILLSGGAAELFGDATRLECEYDANVVFRGLNRVIECEY